MTALPRLGFLGVGWIGRHRMEVLAGSGAAEVAAIADRSVELALAARQAAPGAAVAEDLEGLLQLELDGIVIATPSALHAAQATRALERGLSVFCQKPLGLTAEQTRRVVEAARRADRLLGVDLSYRHCAALEQLRSLVRGGALGKVYAAELAFHNAYGPDKPWFYDRRLSGGGCVIDLGIHLVDAILWLLDFPEVRSVQSRLFRQGEAFVPGPSAVEDHAVAQIDLEGGCAAQLACSWGSPAGQDAVISARLYGSAGGACFRNVGGSFYDFVAERCEGTRRTLLAEPPDAWGGRALVAWARRLRERPRFDAAAEELVRVADVIDALYG